MRCPAWGRVGRYLACAWVLGSLSAVVPAAETGNVCVRTYSAGITCIGSDVGVSTLVPVSILEDCPSGDPATAEAIFEVWLSAGITRYDIGLFLALNGDSALSGGQCLHDYLEPPLDTEPVYSDVNTDGRTEILNGPWWNGEPFVPGDDCGDMEGGTDAVKTLVAIRFACVDSTSDGVVDMSTCTSWSAGTSSTCSGLSAAAPGTGARCQCNIVETGVPMATGEPSGEVTGLTLAGDGAGNLALSWLGSCVAGDTDYAVYEGLLGDYESHTAVLCSTGGATGATFQPRPENSYYLVVPRNAAKEGSYGLTSSAAERPPSTSACLPQLIGGCP